MSAERAAARSIAAIAFFGTVLGASLPRAATAKEGSGERRATKTPTTVLDRVLTLRAPPAAMVRIARSTTTLGSTELETVLAARLCRDEGPHEGCSAAAFADELPAHEVELSSYWIDATEVTVADYRRCVSLRRCSAPPFDRGATRFDQPPFPVSLVTFEEAAAYCAFRGARLPTEAEFERAARGLQNRRFPWGNLYHSKRSNHGRRGLDSTDGSDGHRELAPVASYAAGATPDGIHDLAGNVAEWVSDRHAPYPMGASSDPTGPPPSVGAPRRIARGGSYLSSAPWLRGAARNPDEPPVFRLPMRSQRIFGVDPGVRSPTVGFRCVRPAGRSRQE